MAAACFPESWDLCANLQAPLHRASIAPIGAISVSDFLWVEPGERVGPHANPDKHSYPEAR